MNKKAKFITLSAMIAAMYVVLTLISSMFGLSNGMLQLRLSEILTVLPAFTPAAIPGLFIGCLLANFLSASLPTDIIFGSLATFIGAVGTYYLGRRKKALAVLPPIISNAVIMPFVLKYAYHLYGALPFFMLTIALSEFLTAGVGGSFLAKYLSQKGFGNKNHHISESGSTVANNKARPKLFFIAGKILTVCAAVILAVIIALEFIVPLVVPFYKRKFITGLSSPNISIYKVESANCCGKELDKGDLKELVKLYNGSVYEDAAGGSTPDGSVVLKLTDGSSVRLSASHGSSVTIHITDPTGDSVDIGMVNGAVDTVISRALYNYIIELCNKYQP